MTFTSSCPDPARPATGPEVYEDYAASLAALQDRADYIALNMSCPNSAGDRDFFDELPRAPPVRLFTVRHARSSASPFFTPRLR